MNSPIIALMKQLRIPLVRENYIALAFPGVDEKDIGPQYEADIPACRPRAR